MFGEVTERKLLAHFLDTNFDTSYQKTNYERLGEDLEEYNYETGVSVETKTNIIGQQITRISGYEVSASVEPIFLKPNDALSEQVWKIFNNRSTGEDCRTSIVDVLYRVDDSDEDPVQEWAYRQDAVVALESIGGDTNGIQGTLTIYPMGDRVKGTYNEAAKTFTPLGE